MFDLIFSSTFPLHLIVPLWMSHRFEQLTWDLGGWQSHREGVRVVRVPFLTEESTHGLTRSGTLTYLCTHFISLNEMEAPEGRNHRTFVASIVLILRVPTKGWLSIQGNRKMEKACHQLREENLKALFNHKYTYSAPGLCFHLNHAHRAPAPQLSCQKSLVFQL